MVTLGYFVAFKWFSIDIKRTSVQRESPPHHYTPVTRLESWRKAEWIHTTMAFIASLTRSSACFQQKLKFAKTWWTRFSQSSTVHCSLISFFLAFAFYRGSTSYPSKIMLFCSFRDVLSRFVVQNAYLNSCGLLVISNMSSHLTSDMSLMRGCRQSEDSRRWGFWDAKNHMSGTNNQSVVRIAWISQRIFPTQQLNVLWWCWHAICIEWQPHDSVFGINEVKVYPLKTLSALVNLILAENGSQWTWKWLYNTNQMIVITIHWFDDYSQLGSSSTELVKLKQLSSTTYLYLP